MFRQINLYLTENQPNDGGRGPIRALEPYYRIMSVVELNGQRSTFWRSAVTYVFKDILPFSMIVSSIGYYDHH